MKGKIYTFSAKDILGREISMEEFKGKTLLIVNTASKCGFTPQYAGLEKLYGKYKDRGLVILGFPCNQFGRQEPGDERSIIEGCLSHYGVSFPMFSKIRVNGGNAHPIYKYLKKELGNLFGGRISWNFTKFLISSEGIPVKRFSSSVKPEKIGEFLEHHLGMSN